MLIDNLITINACIYTQRERQTGTHLYRYTNIHINTQRYIKTYTHTHVSKSNAIKSSSTVISVSLIRQIYK